MRRPEFALDRERALLFLSQAEVVHLATTTPAGAPVLRTLNAAVVDDWLLFHGAQAGEKAACLGRPAVIAADRLLASVPSYFVDPERACPATSFYESVQVHGLIERIDAVQLKARMLTALMLKYQPEGGYAPITTDSPLYERAIRGVLVFGVRLDDVTGKIKVGQNRKPQEFVRVIERLWARGAATDAAAIQRMLIENSAIERPPRFKGPRATLLEPVLDAAALPTVLELLGNEYWNRDFSRERIARAHLASRAWVGARLPSGELVATARAISDGHKHALVLDVAVRSDQRGAGIGKALVEFLLDHPALRHASLVRLGTSDAQGFYEKLGFVRADSVNLGFPVTSMVRFTPETGV